MKEGKKQISVITIILGIIIVIGIIAIVWLVINNASSKSSTNSSDLTVKDIPGDEFVSVEGDTRVNISEQLKNEKGFDMFVFSNFNVYSVDSVSRIEYEVTNISEERATLDDFNINIYDTEDLVETITCKGEELAAGQTKSLSVIVNADISNLYNLDVSPVYTNGL